MSVFPCTANKYDHPLPVTHEDCQEGQHELGDVRERPVRRPRGPRPRLRAEDDTGLVVHLGAHVVGVWCGAEQGHGVDHRDQDEGGAVLHPGPVRVNDGQVPVDGDAGQGEGWHVDRGSLKFSNINRS